MPLPLFAMHISDGALATPWWACGFAGMAVLLLIAAWRVREQEVPRIGVLSAAFFVAAGVHVPLVVIPATVHLILNGLMGVVLGRRAPLAIAIGLTLQYYLLQHGGQTTLGINTCTVALPAVAAGMLYPVLRRLGVSAFARGALLGGGAVAATAILDFFVLLWGGKEDWERLAQVLLLAHVPVVIVEALMLGVLVRYLEKVKPELLSSGERPASAGQ
jgi:cobalt/nickel transport system permease protein